MIWYRHADARYPFLWEDAAQPSARWHGAGEGPANYFADTPDGAWAEFLRHEEITSLEDLAGVSRAIWAVKVLDSTAERPSIAHSDQIGDEDSYVVCQEEARTLRLLGATRLIAPSAALQSGSAAGWGVDEGEFRMPPPRDGHILVIFGGPNGTHEIEGWMAAFDARPPVRVILAVRHFGGSLIDGTVKT